MSYLLSDRVGVQERVGIRGHHTQSSTDSCWCSSDDREALDIQRALWILTRAASMILSLTAGRGAVPSGNSLAERLLFPTHFLRVPSRQDVAAAHRSVRVR